MEEGTDYGKEGFMSHVIEFSVLLCTV